MIFCFSHEYFEGKTDERNIVKVMSPNGVLYCVKKGYFTKDIEQNTFFLHKLQVCLFTFYH